MNIAPDATATGKKRLCFGIDTIRHPERLLETDWDDRRLNCVIAHFQLLHWHEMPTNYLRYDALVDDDIYNLLLQIYPGHIWRPGEEPAFMQDVPEHEGEPLCLDTHENWEYWCVQVYEERRREIQDAVFLSPYSYEEQRDIMLRHLYEQMEQKYPPCTGRLLFAPLARALYVGEIDEGMNLTTLGGKKLEYTLREFARGCDRLYDPDAAATVATTITRLEAEGNIPMLQSLIAVLTEKQRGFVTFCVTDGATTPADWLKRWMENAARLRTEAEAAIAAVQMRDAEETVALSVHCRTHMRQGREVAECPAADNAFRSVLERGGFAADALWPMTVRSIAAEIPPTRDSTVVKFLCLNWSFAEAFTAALQSAPTAETALAYVIHQWRKDWSLPYRLWELEERDPPLFFEDDDPSPDFDELEITDTADDYTTEDKS